MILAYKGTSFWPSKLIRWMSWSEYSHVAWLMADGSVIEAWSPKVRQVYSPNFGHKPGTVVDMFEIPVLSIDEQANIEAFLVTKLGASYDWKSVFRFLPRIKQAKSSESKWFCSEIIFDAMKFAGIKLFREIEGYKITPGMLVTSPLLRKVRTFKVGEYNG